MKTLLMDDESTRVSDRLRFYSFNKYLHFTSQRISIVENQRLFIFLIMVLLQHRILKYDFLYSCDNLT